MNHPLNQPKVITSGVSDWMLDRLTEARGILADVPQHPDTLVILACRVVAGQTRDARECGDAVELLRFLNRPGFTGGQNSRRIARYGTDTREEDREAVFT